MFISIIAVDESDDVTICEEGGTVFSCELNTANTNAKQKHLGCKKGEANQKQQLSDYKSIHSYTCD